MNVKRTQVLRDYYIKENKKRKSLLYKRRPAIDVEGTRGLGYHHFMVSSVNIYSDKDYQWMLKSLGCKCSA